MSSRRVSGLVELPEGSSCCNTKAPRPPEEPLQSSLNCMRSTTACLLHGLGIVPRISMCLKVIHELYKEVVQGCEHCTKKIPPLQRSTSTGLRADINRDIVFIDHADVQIRGETYIVLIVIGGATTFVTAFAPRAQESNETIQCLTEWMDTFH